MEKKNTVARRDPLREVVDYEDLVISRELIARTQIPEYWTRFPTPLRPLGRIRYEGVRQLATFLLPLALMGAGAYFFGLATLLGTVPAGLLIGRAMDRKLAADIKARLTKDEAIDRGRYRAVQILSAHLGIPANEITLEMVQKMASDCDKVEHAVAQRQKDRKAVDEQAALSRAKRHDSSRGRRTAQGVGVGVAAGSIAALADADGVLPDDMFNPSIPSVNPANGLPMVSGPFGVDVGGNVFGSDFHN